MKEEIERADEGPARRTVAFPVVIVDFEASGLSRLSYPIEVGFSRWRGWDDPIETWSTLIRPTAEWLRSGFWSKDAEAVHGLKMTDLEDGLPVETVCARLNDEIGDGIAHCDGLHRDSIWCSQLHAEAGIKPRYRLEDMIPLRRLADPGFAEWLEEDGRARHRAGDDALRLMRAFAYGMGRRPERTTIA